MRKKCKKNLKKFTIISADFELMFKCLKELVVTRRK